MRKAIHLYRMVSDLRRELCNRLALQPASTNHMNLLPQGILLTGCSVTQAPWLPIWLHLKLEPKRQELLISSFCIFQWLAGLVWADHFTFQSVQSMCINRRQQDALFRRGIRELVNMYTVLQRYEILQELLSSVVSICSLSSMLGKRMWESVRIYLWEGICLFLSLPDQSYMQNNVTTLCFFLLSTDLSSLL